MSIYHNFKPTRLYIKRCSLTGLKYFGKTIREDIYGYTGSGKYWTNHWKKHGRKFIVTDWVSNWFYDPIELKEFALAFSELFDIVKSKNWANLKSEDGLDGGGYGEEYAKLHSIRMIELQNSEEWKTGNGKLSHEKRVRTVLNPEYKRTKGKASRNKMLQTKKVDGWLETIGYDSYARAAESNSKTKSSIEWKLTTGKETARKISETKQNEEWKNTTGKETNRKISEIRTSEEFKKKHYKTCDKCNAYVDPGNFKKHHGENCIKVQCDTCELFFSPGALAMHIIKCNKMRAILFSNHKGNFSNGIKAE